MNARVPPKSAYKPPVGRAAPPSRARRWLLIGGAVAGLIAASAVGAGYFVAGIARGKLELLAKEAGLQLQLASLTVSPLGKVHVAGLALRRSDGSVVLATEDAAAWVSPWRALLGKRRPERAEVHGFVLDARVEDGKPRELLELYKALRKVFPRKERREDESADKSSGTMAFTLDRGVVTASARGKGADYLPQGLKARDITARVDLTHGVGDLSALVEGSVQSRLSAKLVAQPSGPPRLEARFEPEFRLELPPGKALPAGVDSVAISGLGFDASDGVAIENIVLRKGVEELVRIARVRPDRSTPGLRAEQIAFSLPEPARPEVEPAKPAKAKVKPGAPSQPLPPNGPAAPNRLNGQAGPNVPNRQAAPKVPNAQAASNPAGERPTDKVTDKVNNQPADAAVEPPQPPAQRLWKGEIAAVAVGLGGVEGGEIALVARLERLKASLPGGIGELGVEALELRTDRMPGDQPLDALALLRVTQPSLDIPWRQEALAQFPGGKSLWAAVVAAENAKLREQIEDDLAEEIDDPSLPPEVRKKKLAERLAAKLRAAGVPAADGESKPAAQKQAEGAGKAEAGKKPERGPNAASKSALAQFAKPLKDLHGKLLGADKLVQRLIDVLGQAPRLKVSVEAGRVGLVRAGADKPFGGIQDFALEATALMGDGSRALKVTARPYDDERPWGQVSGDVVIGPGPKLSKAHFALAGSEFAQALRVVSSGVTIRPDSDIAVSLDVALGDAPGQKLAVTGDFVVKKVGFDWWRLAPHPIDDLSASGKVEFLALGDGTLRADFPDLTLGQARTHLLLEATAINDKPLVHLRAEMPRQDCGAVAKSIPTAMLATIGSIEAKGEMSLLVDLTVPLQNAYKANLELAFDDATCEVTQFGNVKVEELAQDFSRPVNENGTLLDDVQVGPTSGAWVPLAELKPWTPWSMIATEDGRFYKHRGIAPGLVLRAIRLDLDYGRFVYGGSTITQQLVKNIFLTRAKNLSRKFEELLIVWQMERKLPNAKDRILELYINFIEFGPKIYGLQRAAQTYFAKDAKLLTPLESAFLAANKPCPRCGYARFVGKKWDPWWQERMIGIMTKMRDEGIISEEQYVAEAPYIPHFVGWPTSNLPPTAPSDDGTSPPKAPAAPGGAEE